MKSLRTGTEAQAHRPTTSTATPRSESTRDVLDVLSNSIARTVASQTKPEPLCPAPEVQTQPGRELLTEKMLADRWVCSVARLQRWRTVGEGPPYLKSVGKVLYRLKDIEAYEEASLVRRMF